GPRRARTSVCSETRPARCWGSPTQTAPGPACSSDRPSAPRRESRGSDGGQNGPKKENHMAKKYTYRRHAVHIENIGGGGAGLCLGPSGPTAEGPEGRLRVRSDGAVKFADGERYRTLEVCPTTGALIIEEEES